MKKLILNNKFCQLNAAVILSVVGFAFCNQTTEAAIYNFSFSNVNGPVAGTVQGQISLPDGNGTFAATSLTIISAPVELGYTTPIDVRSRWTQIFANNFTVSNDNITAGSFAAQTVGITDGFTINFLPGTFGSLLSPLNVGSGNFTKGVWDKSNATLIFTTVPEPSASVLTVAGLCGFLGLVRRRTH